RRRGRLVYDHAARDLASEIGWATLINRLWKCPWIVYPKATVAGAEHALDYLARYTHRVAISDHRILSLQAGQVTFAWRDRSSPKGCAPASRTDKNQLKTMTLPAEQFMARFLLHILPGRFAKIRYFGWLGARNKRTALAGIRTILGADPPEAPLSDETPAERILRLTHNPALPPRSHLVGHYSHTWRPSSDSSQLSWPPFRSVRSLYVPSAASLSVAL
ncbi:MAG: transposase, partial [Verrucomicrobia bacterium]|nr:transposase [Verrucomicrobiota bacterium]